jgi:hypothetical protein
MTNELKTGYVTEGGSIVTPEARISFVYLHEAQQPNKENGLREPKYSVVLLFPADADLTLLKNAAKEACIAKWGSDPQQWPAGMKSPFRDQGEKQFEGYEPGCKMIIPTSKFAPDIVGPSGKPIPLAERQSIYAGCWGRASVNAFDYKTGDNVGVSFGLQNFQKLRDDEPLGGRERAVSQFKPVAAPAGAAPSQGAATGTKASNIFD